MDVRVLLARGTAELAAAGVASPRVDAELLLAHVLAVPRSRLVVAPPPSADRSARFDELIRRRAGREPLQHLLGTAAFRNLELAVGPGVFVPRPETELMLDLTTTELASARVVVDLCAGSGALALAVADEYPVPRVVAVESDDAALAWLRRNAARSRVEIVAADIADTTALAELEARVDVVLCNPPYVPSGTPVGPEVAHDPAVAVFAGSLGLDLMSTVSRTAARLLRPGGLLAVEHDDTQGDSVPALLRTDGWTDVVDHRDLSDRPRFTLAHARL